MSDASSRTPMRTAWNHHVVFCVALICALVGGTQDALAQSCITPPLASVTITSNFGPRLHPTLGTLRPHNGADFRAPMLTPVLASTGGTVTRAFASGGGGGNTIVIRGDNGIVTHYLHLSRFLVAEGQQVRPGEQIGLSGNTGHMSTAPHLHFEVREGGGSVPRDPRLFLCPRPGEVAGAGPLTTDQPIQAPTAPNLTLPATPQELRTSAVAMYSIDAEWKKQVYTMSSEQTAYQLIAELTAKRIETRNEIAKARERLELMVAQLMVANMDSEVAVSAERAAARSAASQRSAR